MIVFDVVKANQTDTRALVWVEDRSVWSAVLCHQNLVELVRRVRARA